MLESLRHFFSTSLQAASLYCLPEQLQQDSVTSLEKKVRYKVECLCCNFINEYRLSRQENLEWRYNAFSTMRRVMPRITYSYRHASIYKLYFKKMSLQRRMEDTRDISIFSWVCRLSKKIVTVFFSSRLLNGYSVPLRHDTPIIFFLQSIKQLYFSWK